MVLKLAVAHTRSSHPEVFLEKGVLEICSKFTEHPCRSAISIKLQSNFIEITLQHGCCSPVNLLRIFRTPLGGCFWHTFYHWGKMFIVNNNNARLMVSVRSKKAIKKHQNYTVGITLVYLLFTLKKNPPSNLWLF